MANLIIIIIVYIMFGFFTLVNVAKFYNDEGDEDWQVKAITVGIFWPLFFLYWICYFLALCTSGLFYAIWFSIRYVGKGVILLLKDIK